MFIFRNASLALDIQFLCSCTEEAVYPTSRFHHLLIVLCVALRSLELFPVQFGMSTASILLQLIFQWSCWWNNLGVLSDVSMGYSYAQICSRQIYSSPSFLSALTLEFFDTFSPKAFFHRHILSQPSQPETLAEKPPASLTRKSGRMSSLFLLFSNFNYLI